jgi:hypothetical protein
MKRRGFSVLELVVSMAIMMLVVLGSTALLLTGLRSFNRTTNSVTITQQNAQGMRRIAETLRGAIDITISEDGRRIEYSMPVLAGGVDPFTGEPELAIPLQSDGVLRGFVVNFQDGTLRELETDRVLVQNVTNMDPNPQSSQYGQVYSPFQATNIGSLRAVTINLITQLGTDYDRRSARMKTTVLVRNSP